MELPTEMAPAPADPAEWEGWLGASAARAATALSDDAMDAPVFNAAADGRTGAEFWAASLLNESVVHGADAAHAAGRPIEVEPDVAAPLVGNHLAMLTSPTWAAQRSESAEALRGTGQVLHLRSIDAAPGDVDAWTVERRPDGAVWRPGPADGEDVTVEGPAGALLLLLTRRLALDVAAGAGIRVDGEVDLLRHWLDSTAHVAD